MSSKSSSLSRSIISTLRPFERILETKYKVKPVTWTPVVVRDVLPGSEDSVKVKIRGVEMTVKAPSHGDSVEIKCPRQTRLYGTGRRADIIAFANDVFTRVAELLRDDIGKQLQGPRVSK